MPESEEERFRRALRPSWDVVELWFLLLKVVAISLLLCLVIFMGLAGGWIRWKLFRELGWI